MKKALKFISLLLVVSLVFAFASCSPKVDNNPNDETTTEVPDTNVNVEDTTLSKDAEVLTIGVSANSFPYEYKDGEKVLGINIDLASAVAKKLGMKLEIVTFSADAEAVKTIDIVMNQSTLGGAGFGGATYSNTYASDIQSVVVKASEDYVSYEEFYTGFDGNGNPTGVKDGVKIAVKRNTTGDLYASETLENWGFLSENVIRFDTNDDAISKVLSGEAVAAVVDDIVAKDAINNKSGLKILDTTFYSADYKAAVICEDEEKAQKIVTAINSLISDGTANTIVENHIK